MKHVHIAPLELTALRDHLSPARAAEFDVTAARARALLEDRTVWHVNATATGGGVAEMLSSVLSYWHAAGIDTRWLVLRGNVDFFRLTKRIHNALHGELGDGGPLGAEERAAYEEVLADNVEAMRQEVRPGDVVVLHDPQTAGLVRPLEEAGALVTWRCHIGSDATNARTDAGWGFLRPYISGADAFVFSRRSYAPAWLPADRLHIIPPCIDPTSAKNMPLTTRDIAGILTRTGLARDGTDHEPFRFTRRDGREDVLPEYSGVLVNGSVPPLLSDRLVLQVSRWDRLKDMHGVMRGFTERLTDLPDDVHLMLAGPEVSGVTDDPEGAEELSACIAAWRALPGDVQRRVHLAALPMDDADENAVMVNALQRHARVVVQKSLMEGFGLTVTEAMWKGRPVVASAVGGISDQIRHGIDGLLVRDPADLGEFAEAVRQLITDQALADRMGAAGRERVRDAFLGDRHLRQWVDLLGRVVTAGS